MTAPADYFVDFVDEPVDILSDPWPAVTAAVDAPLWAFHLAGQHDQQAHARGRTWASSEIGLSGGRKAEVGATVTDEVKLGVGGEAVVLDQDKALDTARMLEFARPGEDSDGLEIGKSESVAQYSGERQYATDYVGVKRTGEDSYEVDLAKGDGTVPPETVSLTTVNGTDLGEMSDGLDRYSAARTVPTDAGSFHLVPSETKGRYDTTWPEGQKMSLTQSQVEDVGDGINGRVGDIDEFPIDDAGNPLLGPNDPVSSVKVPLSSGSMTITGFGQYEAGGYLTMDAPDMSLRLPAAQAESIGSALAEASPVMASALWQFGDTPVTAAARRKPRMVSGPSLQELDDAADQMAALVAVHLGRVAGFAARSLGGLTVAASAEPAEPLWAFHLPGKHDQSSHGKGNWRGAHAKRTDAVSATAKTPVTGGRSLGGGWSASTKIEEHEGGTLVRKDFPPGDHIRNPQDQADAERLGSLTASAMGVNAPAVAAAGPHSVVMEHVSGKPWSEVRPYGGSPPSSITDSDQGRMTGLFDIVTGNPDRNSGNVMVTDETGGGFTAIDHSLAFSSGWSAGTSSPFAQSYINESGNNWADSIDVSPSDMGTIRTRLDGLSGEFAASGRGDWHDLMMERLDALAPLATGTADRL